jgi:hypothetical protein
VTVLERNEFGTTVVMDSTSYSSVQVDGAPNKAYRKNEITDWLRAHNIPFTVDVSL